MLFILLQVGAVELKGFVNGLAFASDGRFLLCAMGQEHRLGRWERITGGAKNALAFVPLSYVEKDDEDDESSEEEEEHQESGSEEEEE